MIIKRIENIIIFVLTLLLSLTLLVRFFGIESFVVLSDSMYPTFRKNDMIFVDKIENATKDSLHEGDVIAFYKGGKLVIHRVVTLNENNLITKGDNNDTNDNPIAYNDVYGKHLFTVWQLGLLLEPLSIVILVSLFAVYKLSFKIAAELKKKV